MSKKLFDILKSTFVFQDFLSWMKTSIPMVLEHNLGKYDALKKAFYLTALENLEGDYLEFGIFTGSSFVCAMRAHRKLKDLAKIRTKFYGFDSFQGFGEISEEDKHWFYLNDTFTINKRKVLRFIEKKSRSLKINYNISEGFFEDTIKNKSCHDFGISKIRIGFIDCDLKQPAKLALDFMKTGMQEGMILLMDDFFSFKGSSEKGVAGAFYEFCRHNKHIHFMKLFDYGCLGSVFVVERIEGM